MGFWSSSVAVLVLAMAAATVASAATNHVVGGSTGWNTNTDPNFYSNWAATQSFAVGDTLEFDFTTGQHTVDQVTKSGYDACSTADKIGTTFTTGPVNIPLNVTGDYYYICGVPGHCSGGYQKVTVSVGSSPAPSTMPSSGGSPTSSGLRTGVGSSLGAAVLSIAASLVF